jgi:hypothetical protein
MKQNNVSDRVRDKKMHASGIRRMMQMKRGPKRHDNKKE